MQCSSTDQTTDCLGGCTDLTKEELDQITDNIHRTLTHPKGNELFASYLAPYEDYLACLNVYNICTKYLTEEQTRPNRGNSSEEPESLDSLESLVTKVRLVQKTVRNMNEIDHYLMKQFTTALKKNSRKALLDVLEDTKEQCQNSLRKMHERFRGKIKGKDTST